MQILGKCNLIDIRRMRDRYSKHFTFKKVIFLDIYEEAYIIFAPNIIQESMQETNILLSVCSDHYTILLSHNKSYQINLARNFLKFNKSFAQDKTYISKTNAFIKQVKTSLGLMKKVTMVNKNF